MPPRTDLPKIDLPKTKLRSNATKLSVASLVASVLASGLVMLASQGVHAIDDNQDGVFAAQVAERRATEARCETLVAPITSGYGADGPYKIQSADVTGLGEDAPIVFSPAAPGRWPVIFLAHGYGPNKWQGYKEVIEHLVSRGLVVVYGTYPMRETNDQRYAALWSSFLAATRQFGDRMDLGRVGFVGHSLGGGAIPSMAFKGTIEKGWGRTGSFTFILAPYYAFEAPDTELARLPATMTQAIEVYDKDIVNDHRMAIDLFDHASADAGRYYFLVRSQTIGSCEIVADHSTPALNPSLRLKQYAVFRPLDALADAAFDESPEARSALAAMGQSKSVATYQPLSRETSPTPATAQNDTIFRWNSPNNPRRASEGW